MRQTNKGGGAKCLGWVLSKSPLALFWDDCHSLRRCQCATRTRSSQHTHCPPRSARTPPPTRSWSGNIASVGGEPAIFDPACYYGHAEAEWVRYSHASYCRRRRYGRERGGGAARPHRLFTQPTTKHNHITTTTINHHHTQRACRGAPALRPRSGPPTLRSRPRRRSSRRGATSTRSTTSSTCAPALPLLLRACLARLSACPLRLLPSLRSASPSSPSQTRPHCAQSHHLLHPNPPPPITARQPLWRRLPLAGRGNPQAPQRGARKGRTLMDGGAVD